MELEMNQVRVETKENGDIVIYQENAESEYGSDRIFLKEIQLVGFIDMLRIIADDIED